MLVCAAEDPSIVLGETSLLVEPRARYVDLPRLAGSLPAPIWPPTEITPPEIRTHTFRIARRPAPARILVGPEDDPTVLPDWQPRLPRTYVDFGRSQPIWPMDIPPAQMAIADQAIADMMRIQHDAAMLGAFTTLAAPQPPPEPLTAEALNRTIRQIQEMSALERRREQAYRHAADRISRLFDGVLDRPAAQEAIRARAECDLAHQMVTDPARLAAFGRQAEQAERALRREWEAEPRWGWELSDIEVGLGYAITREAIDDNLYRNRPGPETDLNERTLEWAIQQLRGPGYAARPHIDVETRARSRERARGLLRSLLTPEQWAEFEAVGHVVEKIGEAEYKLTPGGMIEARKPKLIERWCVNPQSDDWMPVEDQLIGQLLHLRAGPEQLRAQANVFPAGVGRYAGIRDPRGVWGEVTTRPARPPGIFARAYRALVT